LNGLFGWLDSVAFPGFSFSHFPVTADSRSFCSQLLSTNLPVNGGGKFLGKGHRKTSCANGLAVRLFLVTFANILLSDCQKGKIERFFN